MSRHSDNVDMILPQVVSSHVPDHGNYVEDAREEEEDELLLEMEVFMSPELSSHLHLVQYPLSPYLLGCKTMSMPTEARCKPKHQKLQLEFPVNHFHFATNQRPNGIPYGMDLKSRAYASQSVASHTHTAMGLIHPNPNTGKYEVHLIPMIHPTMQMRPSFQHIDDLLEDENEKEEERKRQKQEEEDKKKNTPIQLKKKENERATAIRQSSYAYFRSLVDSEEWVDLDVVPHGDKQLWYDRAICPASHQINNVELSRHMSEEGYVHSLNYLPLSLEDATNMTKTPDQGEGDVKPAVAAKGNKDGDGDDDENEDVVDLTDSSTQQRLRDLTAKLTVLLMHKGGVPMPIDFLIQRFCPSVSINTLQTALSGCAVLLRGNIVIKSSLCGLTPLGQDVRDCAIIVLNNIGYVERRRLAWTFRSLLAKETPMEETMEDEDELQAAINYEQGLLADELITAILQKMCKRIDERAWISRMEDDNMFALTYPEWATKYNAFWAKRTSELQIYVDLYEETLSNPEIMDGEQEDQEEAVS